MSNIIRAPVFNLTPQQVAALREAAGRGAKSPVSAPMMPPPPFQPTTPTRQSPGQAVKEVPLLQWLQNMQKMPTEVFHMKF